MTSVIGFFYSDTWHLSSRNYTDQSCWSSFHPPCTPAPTHLQDTESGWTSLHRAFHFGHLAVAGILLSHGASLHVEDSRGRTPTNLLPLPLLSRLSSSPISLSSAKLSLSRLSLSALPASEGEGGQGRDQEEESSRVQAEVFAWGNGANYQLGTGSAGILRAPGRVDALLPPASAPVTAIAAGRFHSAAVTREGELFTWGFGRGGRLGHPDFDIHR